MKISWEGDRVYKTETRYFQRERGLALSYFGCPIEVEGERTQKDADFGHQFKWTANTFCHGFALRNVSLFINIVKDLFCHRAMPKRIYYKNLRRKKPPLFPMWVLPSTIDHLTVFATFILWKGLPLPFLLKLNERGRDWRQISQNIYVCLISSFCFFLNTVT